VIAEKTLFTYLFLPDTPDRCSRGKDGGEGIKGASEAETGAIDETCKSLPLSAVLQIQKMTCL
jgi:hypothetical protein